MSVFVTTTLPYANSITGGHIGHVFELVLADTFCRVINEGGRGLVLFNTGLDENGGKIAQAAQEYYPELTHQEALNKFREKTHESWEKILDVYSIKPYRFYRTSDDNHKEFVLKIWDKLQKEGVIELRDYSGLYCQGCESFKTGQELKGGKCPDHPTTELQEISEPNYFLTPSGRDHFETLDIIPRNRIPEAKNIFENYEGISISRLHDPKSNLIQSPNPEHDIYVWFDALLNYIYFHRYYKEEDFVRYRDSWNKDVFTVQFCGQDNLRFQSIVFQEILAHLGYNTTQKLFVHGIIRDENGQKLSKTLGNYVDPIQIAKIYGSDAVRLYLLCGLPTYSTSKWNNEDLVNLYNAWIVDGFGNLARRVTVLFDKFDLQEELKSVPIGSVESMGYADERTEKLVSDNHEEVYKFIAEGKFNEAGKSIHALVTEGNRYFNDQQPWNKELSPEERKQILQNTLWIVVGALRGYKNFLPESFDLIDKEIREWGCVWNSKERIESVKWFVKLEK